jgi:hypothetical protein
MGVFSANLYQAPNLSSTYTTAIIILFYYFIATLFPLSFKKNYLIVDFETYTLNVTVVFPWNDNLLTPGSEYYNKMADTIKSYVSMTSSESITITHRKSNLSALGLAIKICVN